LSSACPLAFLSPITAQWNPGGDPWPPQPYHWHRVTAGCHPLSPGHTCGPRDAPGVLWTRCCSLPRLQRISVVGARRTSRPASCGFRLPNLRCLQCPVLGISKCLCAFQNIDYPETLASEGSSLGRSGEEGWLDTFGTCRRVGDGFVPPDMDSGRAWSRFLHHSSSPCGNQPHCMEGMAIPWDGLWCRVRWGPSMHGPGVVILHTWDLSKPPHCGSAFSPLSFSCPTPGC